MTRHTWNLTIRQAHAATTPQEKRHPIRTLLIAGSTASLLTTTGCATTTDDATQASAAPRISPATPHTVTVDTPPGTMPPTSRPAASSVPASSSPDLDPVTTVADGTIVRFAAGDVAVDVTITADNPTTRDFLSLLPLTLTFEEFNGREKISYLPRELDTAGSPGSDPEDGDLIYYVPWGNLGLYYNTDGIGFSDQVIHLGIFDATLDQLGGLEAGDVTVEVAG